MRLQITNFQSIKQADITFTGFTTIYGKSNVGKSATRRAIELALFNSWDKSFMRQDTKQTKVSLSYRDISVEAIKSSTENTFIVNGVTHNKMGREKPNISTLSQELNVATQLEPLYMVAYKDTENTKILNNIFGIDRIEQAQYLCGLDLRRAKQEVNFLKEKEADLQKEVKELTPEYYANKELLTFYDELSDLKIMIESYLKLIGEVEVLSKEKENLNGELVAIDNKITLLNQFILLSKYIKTSKEIETLERDKIEVDNAINQCYSIILSITEMVKQITLLSNYVKTSKEIKTLERDKLACQGRFDKLDGTIHNLSELFNRFILLSKYINTSKEIEILERDKRETSNGLNLLDKELTEFTQKYSKCPYCNNIMLN